MIRFGRLLNSSLALAIILYIICLEFNLTFIKQLNWKDREQFLQSIFHHSRTCLHTTMICWLSLGELIH